MTVLAYDATALGSDVPRSLSQLLFRRLGSAFVAVFGLNRNSRFATEVVQSICPALNVPTAHGPLFCKGGHGRLRWRARSFHDEEPETIAWLDGLGADDVLWDVGANVGMYAIYAAKFRGAKVFAFEPEGQNNALLIENIALNGVGERCLAVNVPLSNRTGFGYLDIRYVTKGGAYNHFSSDGINGKAFVPLDLDSTRPQPPVARQLLFGATIDCLASFELFEFPTHLKIDVDGLEPAIVAGAAEVIADHRLRSILIEVNRKSPKDVEAAMHLADQGFRLVSERSNWLYREDRDREHENPTTNMIFARR